MGADQLRQNLPIQIDQLDDRLLPVIDSVINAMRMGHSAGVTAEEYEASLTPMSVRELVARARASEEDIKAGRTFSVSEVEALLGL